MNKTETVVATNKSMGAYCSEVTDGKITMRSVTIARTPRHYFDLCDLLDSTTSVRQATKIKRVLLDAFIRCPYTNMMYIIYICLLNVSGEEGVRRIMRSHNQKPQRSITVRQALNNPSAYTITATIVMHPHEYWKIERRFFPDLQKE